MFMFIFVVVVSFVTLAAVCHRICGGQIDDHGCERFTIKAVHGSRECAEGKL
jgi:hypothetical protein